jgi:hypothetical protein
MEHICVILSFPIPGGFLRIITRMHMLVRRLGTYINLTTHPPKKTAKNPLLKLSKKKPRRSYKEDPQRVAQHPLSLAGSQETPQNWDLQLIVVLERSTGHSR